MKYILFFVVFSVVCLSCFGQTTFDVTSGEVVVAPSSPPFLQTLITNIVNKLANKIAYFLELFNFKVRLVNFLISLWTPENIDLFRTGLNLTARLCRYIYRLIPSGSVAISDGGILENVLQIFLVQTGLTPTTEAAKEMLTENPNFAASENQYVVSETQENPVEVPPPDQDRVQGFLARYREAQNLHKLIESGQNQ